jgi:short-subunit dehydrogenase
MLRYHTTSPNGHSPELAIVTGASSGIGAAVAERLVARGYRVLGIARRWWRMEELSRRLGSDRFVPQAMDLSAVEQIEPGLRPLLEEYGPASVLVNNAGAGSYHMFLDHEAAEFSRLMQVNYFAAVEMTRLVLPGMLSRGRGVVINVGSMSSKMGAWGHTAYAPTKAAMVCLSRTLAAEYERSGVHFCVVNPGIIRTDYFNNPQTHGLWQLVQQHARDVGPCADSIVSLIDRPRLETCFPRFYRIVDWIKALSPRLALRIVTANTRPRSAGREVVGTAGAESIDSLIESSDAHDSAWATRDRL